MSIRIKKNKVDSSSQVCSREEEQELSGKQLNQQLLGTCEELLQRSKEISPATAEKLAELLQLNGYLVDMPVPETEIVPAPVVKPRSHKAKTPQIRKTIHVADLAKGPLLSSFGRLRKLQKRCGDIPRKELMEYLENFRKINQKNQSWGSEPDSQYSYEDGKGILRRFAFGYHTSSISSSTLQKHVFFVENSSISGGNYSYHNNHVRCSLIFRSSENRNNLVVQHILQPGRLEKIRLNLLLANTLDVILENQGRVLLENN